MVAGEPVEVQLKDLAAVSNVRLVIHGGSVVVIRSLYDYYSSEYHFYYTPLIAMRMLLKLKDT